MLAPPPGASTPDYNDNICISMCIQIIYKVLSFPFTENRYLVLGRCTYTVLDEVCPLLVVCVCGGLEQQWLVVMSNSVPL